MKLLFDENISYRVVKKMEPAFPGSQQAKRMGLEAKKDRLIWDFALQNGFTIVTHDEDYAELSFFRGAPPKVVWLRTGNIRTADLVELLLHRAELIVDFIASDDKSGCLELYPLPPGPARGQS